MKNLLSWKSIAAAVAVLLLCSGAVSAQTSTMRVNVPFAFTAGDRVLPAGEYHVMVHTDLMLTRLLPVNSNSVSLLRLVPGTTDRKAENADKGTLRFEKIGSRYVLIGVWRPGEIAGNAIVGSRPARELAKAPNSVDVKAR